MVVVVNGLQGVGGAGAGSGYDLRQITAELGGLDERTVGEFDLARGLVGGVGRRIGRSGQSADAVTGGLVG